jgi:hypothetical protein
LDDSVDDIASGEAGWERRERVADDLSDCFGGANVLLII